METSSIVIANPVYSKLKAWGLKPLVLDFYVQRLWSTFSLERILARVKSVRPASMTASTLRLRPNFNFKNFEPGQHILVTAAVNGHRVTRTYSPTLLPDGSLEITVKAVAQGKLSSYLSRGLRRGDTVEISAPFGTMTWSSIPKAATYVFCAGGVGITPLRSLIHAWDKTSAIELHYWAKSDEFCFREEFESLSARHANLKVHFYTSAEKIRLADVLNVTPGIAVLACGPHGFVQAAREHALEHGQFFVGEAAPSALKDQDQTEETFFEVIYDGQTIHASSKKTILESIEAHGYSPPQGCRMGLCKSCTCLKTSGLTFNSRNQALASEVNEEIQICVSSPRSPLKLERY